MKQSNAARFSNMDVAFDLTKRETDEPQKSKYKNTGRVDLTMVHVEKYSEKFDIDKFKKQEYMQFLTESDRR